MDYVNVSRKIHEHYNYPQDNICLTTKKLYTQHKINKYQNINTLFLNSNERVLLSHISRTHHRLRFSKAGGKVYESKGWKVSQNIVKSLYDFATRRNHQKITLLFGHDTTLFSIASIMGIDIDMPAFNGYFLFEKYPDSSIAVSYNRDPKTTCSIPKVWSLSDEYQRFDSLRFGKFSFDEFCSILRFP